MKNPPGAYALVIWIAQFVGREIRVLHSYEATGQPLAAHLAWLASHNLGPGNADIWLPHDRATHDRIFDVSYESALRQAGYNVEVVPNQGRGAAMARIEAARRLFGSVWFDEARTTAGIEALGWYHEKKDEVRSIGLGPERDWSVMQQTLLGLCVWWRRGAFGGRSLRAYAGAGVRWRCERRLTHGHRRSTVGRNIQPGKGAAGEGPPTEAAWALTRRPRLAPVDRIAPKRSARQ